MPHAKKRKVATFPVLILNIIIPGIGTLLAGNRTEGFWQLGLYFFSIAVFFTGLLFTLTIIGAIIGIPLLVIAPGIFIVSWVWALITSFDN